ncbi:hypothetical protein C7459_104136 [Tumebacillus permanentifrigoris]|uniref:DUF7662 domain-containing protein n=2 Tax=Tumebacillus permanentifrigoris TaxID=378543 RepID=A0A316DFC3_9BACL|nr:hypothetical protein C7459_104136 [Tumebacillus permanentifrigoris]
MYDGKYIKLYHYIKRIDDEVDAITLTCRQIEEILQFKLPASAYKHRAWWANEQKGTHTHSRAWRYAGWKTTDVRIGEKITFVRE